MSKFAVKDSNQLIAGPVVIKDAECKPLLVGLVSIVNVPNCANQINTHSYPHDVNFFTSIYLYRTWIDYILEEQGSLNPLPFALP